MGDMNIGISLENYWQMKCMRRPEGCDCVGCQGWKAGERTDIRCQNEYVAWEDGFDNTVTTEGKNDLLTQYFEGIGYTAAWYVGLISSTNWTAYAATDTAAKITATANPPTTNGWQESAVYAARIAWVGGTAAAGSVDNHLAPASIPITGPDTIRGGFLDTTATVAGTLGKLYADGDFANPRAVLNGDTMLVTVTLTVT